VRYIVDRAAENGYFAHRRAASDAHLAQNGVIMKMTIAVLIMMLSSLAVAQINKCLDGSGKVVAYGAECPAGTRSEQTTIRNAPAPSAVPQKSLAERDADFRKRQMETQEAQAKTEKSSADTAQRKRACQDAQAYLKNLQDGQRIRTTDPKTGERGYLGDSEYPKEIARAKRNVADYCK
jgi:hypothetical protein